MTSNASILIGNVTRDPELRYTPNGSAKVTFGLAVSRRWQNKTTQQWDEETSFFDVVAWSELGENIATTIKKGTRAVVVGRLQQRSWETDTGDKRSKVELIADDVAPSLRWATADVHRVERGGTSTPTSTGGRSQAPATTGYDFTGEEPF